MKTLKSIPAIESSRSVELLASMVSDRYITDHQLEQLPLQGFADWLDRVQETERQLLDHETNETISKLTGLFCELILELESLHVEHFMDSTMAGLLEKLKSQSAPMAKSPAQSDIASEYWNAAHFIESVRESEGLPFSPYLARKFSTQLLCQSVEAEILDRLGLSIAMLWNDRQTAVKSLVDSKNKKLSLNPTLQNFFEALAAKHTDWLSDGKFPFIGAINTLRYLVAVTHIEDFRPSLIELGTLLLIFGLDRDLGDIKLTNHFALEPLDPAQITEISFRMMRLQKLKNRAQSVSPVFEDIDFIQVKDDVEAILQLARLIRGAASEEANDGTKA